ncbi:uncharacterized protein LOC105684731 isoform X1 [Athalia rosae]|uniref:uncharacterized protein LOC105684731 isoform X1 n=2 Tax=Athalia rosae TaxID=37344 RepID=UPI0020334D2F|nr:uncharacterized protein LOC105684731 isoform X1 [Athalia rosae]
MVESSEVLCRSRIMHCMRLPLRSTEQIYLVFLIPTLLNCAIYVIHFSLDLVVVEQHFREGNSIWGSCSLVIMYAPSITYFILTVSRPDWWMSQDEKISKGVITWFMLQVCQVFAFPLFALYRYAGLIVLTVDAIMLSGIERMKTLNIAAKPAAIELYFFLQAWFQAAPQAVFQTHLLFSQQTVKRSHQSVGIQISCILISIFVLSIQTMSFQRFESQRIKGRKLPWAMWLKKYRDQELQEFDDKHSIESIRILDTEKKNIHDKGVAKELVSTARFGSTNNVQEAEMNTMKFNHQISTIPPLPPKNVHITPPPTPLRGVTSVIPLQVPDVLAPRRPDFIANQTEAGNIEAATSRPVSQKPMRSTLQKSKSLKLPKRRYSEKGLDEDDPAGKAIASLWWFLFILPRVFSIAVFYKFHPGVLFTVLVAHYLVMLAYIFYHAKDFTVVTFFMNLWLGLIYIFGAIEYQIKFKYANRWLSFYYAFAIAQNSLFTGTWYFLSEWDGFWYTFVFWAIFGSMGLCIMSTLVYQLLLKPRKQQVYVS